MNMWGNPRVWFPNRSVLLKKFVFIISVLSILSTIVGTAVDSNNGGKTLEKREKVSKLSNLASFLNTTLDKKHGDGDGKEIRAATVNISETLKKFVDNELGASEIEVIFLFRVHFFILCFH